MSEWFERLQRVAAHNKYDPVTFDAGDGRVLVTRHGARVLACEMEGVDHNLFYHHPGMEDVQGAGLMFGGDRFWIAPEVAYFWPDLAKAREDPVKYAAIPSQIDPGNYRVEASGERSLELSTSIELTDCRDSKHISVNVHRGFRLIEPPDSLPSGLRLLSFEITNTLRLLDGDKGAVAGGWDLLQLPVSGLLLCPTLEHVENPRSYYEPFGDKHVQVHDRCVRFLIDARRRIKMGLPAGAIAGRMGYYRCCRDCSSVIVRLFPVQSDQPYVDIPRDVDESVRVGGDCLQAYNDDGRAGEFGEMEYHDPAIIAGIGPQVRSGTSTTHVVIGSDEDVCQAIECLLGQVIR